MRRIDLCTMFMCFIASFKNNLRKQILLTVGQAGSRLAISKTPFLLNYCCSLLILTHIFKESRVLEILVYILHFFFLFFYKLLALLTPNAVTKVPDIFLAISYFIFYVNSYLWTDIAYIHQKM